MTEDGEVTERRRVLGAKKDPFEPAPVKKSKKAKQAEAKTEEPQPEATEAPQAAGTAGGGATAPEPPVSEPPAPKKTYPQYSIKVRFGKTDGELETKTVERLAVLPSTSSPVLVYRGVEEGGEVAVFELTGSVEALGDGSCEPTPEDCQILKLRAGETEFLTITGTGEDTDAQYQLELEKIYTKATTSEAELAEASTEGRKVLQKWSGDRRARYAFDSETGELRKLDATSAKRLTRSARRASL